MKASDVFKAVTYPVTQSSVIIPVVILWLLMSFARWGGILGLFLMLLTIPAVFRFQMILLQARAQDRAPPAIDADFFNWFGNAWSLFPVPLVLIAGGTAMAASAKFGVLGTVVTLAIAGAFLPASFAILAITHSPLQSVNPTAIGRLLRECGDTFWIASAYLIVAAWLIILSDSLPSMLANLAAMLLVSSIFSLIGSLIEPYKLMDDVSIPDALQPDEEQIANRTEAARIDVLSHAYGFVSRGNREGGFKHIIDWIAKQPDAVAAWAWFFERMTRWEEKQHALFFAQHYIHDMLQHGEAIPALKIVMRCRLIDERFKPREEDLPATIEAATASGNIELASVLKGY